MYFHNNVVNVVFSFSCTKKVSALKKLLIKGSLRSDAFIEHESTFDSRGGWILDIESERGNVDGIVMLSNFSGTVVRNISESIAYFTS
jgi:hypothetical protein